MGRDAGRSSKGAREMMRAETGEAGERDFFAEMGVDIASDLKEQARAEPAARRGPGSPAAIGAWSSP